MTWTLDITDVFNDLVAVCSQVIVWMQTHYIKIGAVEASLFDLEIACCILALILYCIPVFRDTFGEDTTEYLYDPDDDVD